MYTDQVRGWGVVRVYVYRPSEGVWWSEGVCIQAK